MGGFYIQPNAGKSASPAASLVCFVQQNKPTELPWPHAAELPPNPQGKN